MADKWRYHIEEGELLCCSSMCDADGGCINLHMCKELPEFVKDSILMDWEYKTNGGYNHASTHKSIQRQQHESV